MFSGSNLTLSSDVDQDIDVWFTREIPSLSIYFTKQVIKRRSNKDKNSTIHATEYGVKSRLTKDSIRPKLSHL